MEHSFFFNRILLVLLITVCWTQATVVQTLYRLVETGQSIMGKILNELTAKSVRDCSLRCTDDVDCVAYQYEGTGPGNCLLINTQYIDSGSTFVVMQNSLIYKTDVCAFNTECLNGATCVDGEKTYSCICAKGYYGDHCEHECTHDDVGTWTPPCPWTGPYPVKYWSFDNLEGFALMEGNVQINFNALTVGKVNYAVSTNRSNSQWIDLGVHTEACMTRPETCGAAGGAISLWVKPAICTDFTGGIITSLTTTTTGLLVLCINEKIRFSVRVDDGTFYLSMDQHPGIWTHVVLNYFGHENGMEIKLYQNGGFLKQGSGKTAGNYSSGDGKLVVGRQITGWNQNYGSVDP